jgi:hypothetical protein
LPIAAGEQLTERQALQALLLPSANNQVPDLLPDFDPQRPWAVAR